MLIQIHIPSVFMLHILSLMLSECHVFISEYYFALVVSGFYDIGNDVMDKAKCRASKVYVFMFVADLEYLWSPSRYTMVPASLYMGFAASIIWVGQV